MVSSWERLLKILLNSTSVGGLSFFLMQPYGNGFAIAIPYWLLSYILTLFRIGFFGAAHWCGWGRGGAFWALLPKIRHTYPTMMKLGTVISYLKRIQKIYESRDTPPEFYWHQHLFTGNQQILLYQEIQI